MDWKVTAEFGHEGPGLTPGHGCAVTCFDMFVCFALFFVNVYTHFK